jgi:hypothetical protein
MKSKRVASENKRIAPESNENKRNLSLLSLCGDAVGVAAARRQARTRKRSVKSRVGASERERERMRVRACV